MQHCGLGLGLVTRNRLRRLFMNKHLKISRALSNTMLNLLMVGIGFCSASLAQPGTDLFKQHHALMIAAIRNNEVERVKALLKTPYVLINDPAYEISYL